MSSLKDVASIRDVIRLLLVGGFWVFEGVDVGSSSLCGSWR